MRSTAIVLSLAICVGAPALGRAEEAVKLDSSTLGGLRARSIGPAAMGGRIAAIDGVGESPATVWVGAASGGVWKSTDDGTTFKPVFDEYTQSIGAIAVDPSKHDTVWVGTGESWMRNSVSVGTGVYKTTDGGASWKAMGLEDSEHIARIAVDPKQSDTVYVCAAGHLWNANEQRGVFKTTDGGKTWKKILYVDADTGCSDLALDPEMPSVLYAGMWQFRRQPDFFNSGGAGSALYKSTDGGEHWQKLTAGIPSGHLGRIAVAAAPSRPSVVYALIESKKTALYRSDDLGEHWRAVNDSFNVTVRPFYFARIVVDPTDFNRVYKPGLMLTYSTDGGNSFSSSIMQGGGGVHSDLHALWINPKDPAELFVGTDGGLYQSLDRAQHWTFRNVLPVSQFYHVAADNERPYNVYGGLQDNGSWTAPSVAPGGVANRHWRNLGGGDGFAVVPDPNDSDIVYLESQGGRIVRVRRSTGETREINPFAKEGETKLRFNWNTPIYPSPQKGVIYLGAQYLFRSKDRGDSWERVSPDLTTNDQSRQKQLESGGLSIDNSSAENYTTIITISESPKNPSVIWVGTDDGNLQVTRDGGKNWTSVAGNVPGLPKRTWVSGVDASNFDDNTAYATFDGHRTGDMKSYVFKTTDGGKTWQPLATSDIKGFAQVVREDVANPRLLFLGTEFGLFISVDGGANWAQFKEEFPPVAVDDIAIHRRDGDVILATHGRGIYIIDDITPLRALTAETLEKDVAMLPSRPSPLAIASGEQRFEGSSSFAAGGVDETASITYYLKKRHIVGDSRVEIYDAAGKLISTLTAGKRRGINRVAWPMRLRAPRMPAGNSLVMEGGSFFGPRLPEGTYTVKLVKGKETYASSVQLVADPRTNYSAEDRALQQKTVRRLFDMVENFTFLTERVLDLRNQAEERAAKLSGSEKKQLTELAAKLNAMHKTLVATREGGWLSGEEQLRERLGMLYGAVNSYDGRPTDSQIAEMESLSKLLDQKAASVDAIIRQDLAAANRVLKNRKLDEIVPLARADWEKAL